MARHPLIIHPKPWYKDHFFGGKTILAAVETMALLAHQVQSISTDIKISTMVNGRFSKFLSLSSDLAEVPVLIESEKEADGIRMKLLSQIQFKKMRRIKEHGEVTFPYAKKDSETISAISPEPPRKVSLKITADRIYRELVPFGPAYRTLQDELLLTEDCAFGYLRSPDFPMTNEAQKHIGSPFPLDGAMHAACVLGRQMVGYTPFPVGFAKRTIHSPTFPATNYLVKVIPISQSAEKLIFDLAIFSADHRCHETIEGLQMRDVSSALPRS